MAVWSVVSLTGLSSTHRLDAEYYQPDYLRYESATASGDPLSVVSERIMHPTEIKRVYVEDGIQILLAQNVRPNRLAFPEPAFMAPSARRILYKNQLQIGDVVMTRSGANFGDAACYLGAPKDLFACADCLVIRPKDIAPGYLATFLNTRIGRGLLNRGAYGAAQPHIAPTYLRELRIPRLGRLEQVTHALIEESYKQEEESVHLYADTEALLVSALGLDRLDLTPRLFYERNYKDAARAGRLDAEYFQPPKWRVLEALAEMPGRTVGEQFRSVRSLWQPDNAPQAARVRNYDLTEALSPFLDETLEPTPAAEIGSTKKRLQAGDLVVSHLRSYLREIALVLPSAGVPMVGSTEFIVLRPEKYAIRAEALLVYLRSPYVQTVLKWCQDGSNHPRFDEKEILRLRMPKVVEDVQDELAALVSKACAARREARRLLDEAKALVEKAVLSANGRESR